MDELGNGDLVFAARVRDSVGLADSPRLMILSLNPSGEVNWCKRFFTNQYYADYIHPFVKAINNNNFLVTCTSLDSIAMVFLKMTSAGDTLLTRSITINNAEVPGGHQINDILQLNGGYIFSGTAEYSVDQSNLLLFRTDSNLNVEWFKSNYYSTLPGDDSGAGVGITKMILANDGNIMLLASSGLPRFLKVTPSGQLLWTKTINDTFSYFTTPIYQDFSNTSDGGFLITGQTDRLAAVSPTVHGSGRVFVMKVDASANIVWSKKYLMAKDLNIASFVSQLPSGDIICTGTIYDTILPSPVDYSKFYLMRLDSLGVSSGIGCGRDALFNTFVANEVITFYNKTYGVHPGGWLLETPVIENNETLTTTNVGRALGVSIALTPSNLCEGQTATIRATAFNGGIAPTFNFMVNGVTQQIGSDNLFLSTSLHYTDSVICIIHNSSVCLTADSMPSNVIKPPVWPTADAIITISSSPGDSVAPGTTVTFTANVVNGGPAPTYMWQKNGVNTYYSATSNTYATAALQEGDQITCMVTTSYCAPDPQQLSNVITMRVPSAVPVLNLAAGITLAPNPAKNELTITRTTPSLSEICLRDMLGRVWLKHSLNAITETIDIATLPDGIYSAEITVGQDKFAKLLMIQK
jgi:hypothetical protein